MVRIVSGDLDGQGLEVVIVLSNFNQLVTDNLLEGALSGLEKCGVIEDHITVVRVPGGFEIPGTARQVLRSRDPDGIICLGAIIRGETPHFDYISNHVSNSIGELSCESDVPVIFGVLTTDTMDQAVERAGVKSGNKGYDSALSLIETINVYDEL